MLEDRAEPGRSRWRRPVGITLVVAAVLCMVQALHRLDGLEAKLLDLRFAIRGEQAPSEAIALVTIQDHTLLDHPALPRDPDLHAKLIRRLTEAGAVAIALDLPDLARRATGSGERTAAGVYQEFTAAIYDSGRVVLPMTVVPASDDDPRIPAPVQRFAVGEGRLKRPVALDRPRLMHPQSAMCTAAAGVGTLNVYPDLDGALRKRVRLGTNIRFAVDVALFSVLVVGDIEIGVDVVVGFSVNLETR